MSAQSRWSVCSKAKVFTVFCLLALAANYLFFVKFKHLNPRDQQKNHLKEVGKRQMKEPGIHSDRNSTWSNHQIHKERSTEAVDGPQEGEEDGASGEEYRTTTASDSRPLCPEKPKELVGSFQTHLDPVNISTVEQKYPEIRKGGNYRPKNCKARERLALVIPCRNRTTHLHILLNNLLGVLMKQKLEFTIFVIDQDLPTTFNRGMLFNVGYLEALKRGNYDCFIFHDVDMIPTNDDCLYRCTHNPRHFLSGVSKWNYGLPYKGYFGGVTALTREQYKTINGGSNLYFGWGGEDDDLRQRILNKGYSFLRYPKYIGRYDTISHKRDTGNKANPARFKLVDTARTRQDEEGLNTSVYNVTETVEERLYTKIKVYINMTQIIQGAPASVRNVVQVLLKQAQAFDAETRGNRLKAQSLDT